jgi:hypothetical protein
VNLLDIKIEMEPVESSLFAAVGYHPEHAILRVRFHNGKTYDHEQIAPEKWEAFRTAPSLGNFYNSHIKRNLARVPTAGKAGRDDAKEHVQELPAADSASGELPVDAHQGQPLREAGTDGAAQTAVESEALAVVSEARQLTVTNPEEYKTAAAELRTIAQHVQRIRDWFKPLKESAHRAHQELCQREKQALDELITVERWLKQQLGTYAQREEQPRIAEQNRLQAERDAEARAIAQKQAEDAQMSLAEELHAAGDTEGAEAVLCQDVQPSPTFVAPVILPKAVPQVEGIGGRTVWKFRITDPTKVPREYLMVDEAKIGGVVRAMKDMTRIAGVEVYPEQVVSARRKA